MSDDTGRAGGDVAIVAALDGKPGCPAIRWDLYSFRCSLGINECAIHGKFETRRVETNR